jgi:hypothetical protein
MEICCPRVPATRAAVAPFPFPSCRWFVSPNSLPLCVHKISLPYFQTTPNLRSAAAFLNYLFAADSLHGKPAFIDDGREVQRCL